jgi:pimeloyl-ACP methyl ester carboxylesterase
MPHSSLKFRWLENLSEVSRESWNALAEPLQTPFLEWDWLQLMEVSGSAGLETGWIPRHLTVWSGRELVAAAPLYVKTHSAGEFVFDHAWADVAGRLNGPVLGLYGGQDTGIPLDTVDRMKAALAAGSAAAKKSEFVIYPDAPHAFHADYRPSFRKEAAEDGWKRCVAWFKANGVA